MASKIIVLITIFLAITFLASSQVATARELTEGSNGVPSKEDEKTHEKYHVDQTAYPSCICCGQPRCYCCY